MLNNFHYNSEKEGQAHRPEAGTGGDDGRCTGFVKSVDLQKDQDGKHPKVYQFIGMEQVQVRWQFGKDPSGKEVE